MSCFSVDLTEDQRFEGIHRDLGSSRERVPFRLTRMLINAMEVLSVPAARSPA